MPTADVHTSSSAADAAPTRRWRDPRKPFWALALAVPLLPFLAGRLVALTGLDLFWYVGPGVLFGVMPVFDQLLGLDRLNPPESSAAALDDDRYYRWCTYLYLPLQLGSLVWACNRWASGDLSTFASFGLALTVGCVAGIAINTAHELGHKHPAVERWLSKATLAQSAYGHFYIEHNRGHHQRVSTPDDPASARFGESFYTFYPRTVIGSARSAVHLERERRRRAGQRFWSPRNDLLNAWAMTVVLFGALLVAFGWSIAPWLVVQAVVGFSLLEVVNYIEHYGLLRERKENGRYERCRPEHSWNASNVASNILLYQLQRHSDHHAYPTRRYQTLRHFDDVPQLPTGYAGMVVLATVPPLWRRVMDPRVLAFYDGDLARVNLSPRRRARLSGATTEAASRSASAEPAAHR